MKYFLLFIAIMLFSQCGTAQKATAAKGNYITKKTVGGKAKKYYEQGIKNSRADRNQEAINSFSKAIKAEPRFIDAHIQWAGMQYFVKDFAKAEKGFEKVLEIDPLYSKKVRYVLGLAEIEQGKIDEGIQHLEDYISSAPKNEILLKKAKNKIDMLQFTATAMAHPVLFDPVNLGKNINTTDPEYLPSLTADEQVLIFTRRVRGQEDFYISRKIDGEWTLGKPIVEINTDNNEGAQSISADGKFLVFTKCDNRSGYGSCDLYFSEFKNDKWTTAANIGSPINTRDWESQPSISADGRSLYFAAKRKTGMGKSDLYVSYRDEKGKWSAPQMLPAPINTTQDDMSPFIHADGQTLYFMSNGQPGMGGFDLYLSRKQKDGSWGKPKNLGYPINTNSDEGNLVVSLSGKKAYYAANSEMFPDGRREDIEKSTGMDIYAFELDESIRPQAVTYVKAKITDAITKRPLQAKAEIIDLSTDLLHAQVQTDEEGTFLIVLPVGKNYALNVSKKQYTFHSEHFALQEAQNSTQAFELYIALQPIEEIAATPSSTSPAVYTPTVLRNVFFDTGSSQLRPSSFRELTRLKELLLDNPSIKIRINGHTDNVGDAQANLQLSEERAKAVRAYLIEEGIEAQRLSYIGYGESKPLSSNDTKEGRQINRRTEFEIIR